MQRDPPERGLVALETGQFEIVGSDWLKRLDKAFIDNLGKHRKYEGKSVRDLLRALRNKVHTLSIPMIKDALKSNFSFVETPLPRSTR